MQNKMYLLISCFASALSFHSYAQAPSLSKLKLEIAKGDTYVVESGNQLFVDTLIMHDKATIVLNPAFYGVLEAKAAYIGKNCIITAKGKDGDNGRKKEHGADGADGGSLTLTLHFVELEDLTIDTRGGDGGKGVNGKNGKRGSESTISKVTTRDAKGNMVSHIVSYPGTPGTAGGNATDGGNGGNGGNAMLVYSTTGFIPIFNSKRGHNSITILHTAGKKGTSGKPGAGGFDNVDGELVLKKQKPARDGRIKLINKNAEVAQRNSKQVLVPSNQDAYEQLPE